MTKPVKRWAVRDWGNTADPMYLLIAGQKPHKLKNHWSKPVGCSYWFCHTVFEGLFGIRLPPGGGPVEIKFEELAS